MTGAALHFDKVIKHYGSRSVLKGLELTVGEGEYFGLVGINGAGKTTLIKSLLDFCRIDAGSITIYGQPHTDTRSRSRLAFLPERFVPPYYLTGRDFLNYMARLHRTAPNHAATEEIFAILDLGIDALDLPVRQFSKGMAQKLGLAACLLSNKDLLVLDEPMSGLDPRARALLKQHLLARKHADATLFYSTHMLQDIEALCDRMGVLHNGELRFVGSPAQLREQYAVDDIEQAYLNCIAA